MYSTLPIFLARTQILPQVTLMLHQHLFIHPSRSNASTQKMSFAVPFISSLLSRPTNVLLSATSDTPLPIRCHSPNSFACPRNDFTPILHPSQATFDAHSDDHSPPSLSLLHAANLAKCLFHIHPISLVESSWLIANHNSPCSAITSKISPVTYVKYRNPPCCRDLSMLNS